MTLDDLRWPDYILTRRRKKTWGEEGKGRWSSRTFDLLFKMIIDLKRSIDLIWLLMPIAIFISYDFAFLPSLHDFHFFAFMTCKYVILVFLSSIRNTFLWFSHYQLNPTSRFPWLLILCLHNLRSLVFVFSESPLLTIFPLLPLILPPRLRHILSVKPSRSFCKVVTHLIT